MDVESTTFILLWQQKKMERKKLIPNVEEESQTLKDVSKYLHTIKPQKHLPALMTGLNESSFEISACKEPCLTCF